VCWVQERVVREDGKVGFGLLVGQQESVCRLDLVVDSTCFDPGEQCTSYFESQLFWFNPLESTTATRPSQVYKLFFV